MSVPVVCIPQSAVETGHAWPDLQEGRHFLPRRVLRSRRAEREHAHRRQLLRRPPQRRRFPDGLRLTAAFQRCRRLQHVARAARQRQQLGAEYPQLGGGAGQAGGTTRPRWGGCLGG